MSLKRRIEYSRYHRKIIRRLRSPKAIIWTSIIIIALFALIAFLYGILHLVYWLSSAAHTPPIRAVIILANMLFGMASALSVILAIWILGDINPEKFTTAQELLRHCIELFDDANKNNCDVKLLILFPNPGQFDETFESPREYDFSDLKKKLTQCFNNGSVHIEIVCFQGDTTSPDSTLRKFLNKFYESESPDINPQLLEKRGNIEGYCGPVKNFKDEYLTNRDRLTLERIDDGWFDKMAIEEEPMIVIGYAKREAFLGAITFKGTKFNFVGFDFDGNVGTIAPLYKAMKAKYTAPPPTSPQATTP